MIREKRAPFSPLAPLLSPVSTRFAQIEPSPTFPSCFTLSKASVTTTHQKPPILLDTFLLPPSYSTAISINFLTQVILSRIHCLHRMSLAAIWSGNFHQIRNSLGSNCCFKLFRLHTEFIPGKVLDAGRCNPRSFTTRSEGRNWKSQGSKSSSINLKLHDGTVGSSTNINTSQSQLHEFKAIQCYDLQEKIADNKVIIDRPATILVFDIETTGFSRRDGRIIEFALRDLIGGKNSTFQTLVNPEKVVLNTDVHGISSCMVNRPDVPRFRELVPILLQYVRSRQMAGKPVLWVAHNGRRFDVPFVINEFQRCSEDVPADWLFVDTLPLARQLVKPDGSKLTSLSLKALREHYDIPLVGPAHRAMQDVTTLCYVLQRITFDLKLTVPELMDRAFPASNVNKVPP